MLMDGVITVITGGVATGGVATGVIVTATGGGGGVTTRVGFGIGAEFGVWATRIGVMAGD